MGNNIKKMFIDMGYKIVDINFDDTQTLLFNIDRCDNVNIINTNFNYLKGCECIGFNSTVEFINNNMPLLNGFVLSLESYFMKNIVTSGNIMDDWQPKFKRQVNDLYYEKIAKCIRDVFMICV